jgi:hypothetical protein
VGRDNNVLLGYWLPTYKIIGNRWDNPELLESSDAPAETVQLGGITVNNHGNVQNQSFTAIGTMEGDLVL